MYAGGELPGPEPLIPGTLDTCTPQAFVLSDVWVALLNASYRFFAYVVFGSQQSDNTVLAFGDVNPAGHAVHEDAALAEYVFAGHTLHAAVPDAALNVPAAHATHGPPFGPVYPGLHKQSPMLVLPNDEFAFAVQLVHAALPFVGLYVPVGHIAHWPLEAPKSSPVYPALHKHRELLSHGNVVRSVPCFIVSEMAVVASVLRNSSTTKTPAKSPLKYSPPQACCIFTPCPIQVFDTVLSVSGEEAIRVDTTPFAVTEHILVDER